MILLEESSFSFNQPHVPEHQAQLVISANPILAARSPYMHEKYHEFDLDGDLFLQVTRPQNGKDLEIFGN
jgi:hypothetical protein